MNDPYSRRLLLTPADRAAWARYEAASKAAAEQYRAMPTSLGRGKSGIRCACGRFTVTSGPCRTCGKAAKRGKSPTERKAMRKAAKP